MLNAVIETTGFVNARPAWLAIGLGFSKRPSAASHACSAMANDFSSLASWLDNRQLHRHCRYQQNRALPFRRQCRLFGGKRRHQLFRLFDISPKLAGVLAANPAG